MLELDKIYCGNSMEVMQEIDDNIIALTVTSPPYNMHAGKYKNSLKPSSSVFKDYRDDMTEGWYKKFLFEFIRLALLKSRYLALNIQWLTSTKEPITFMMNEFRNKLKDIFIWEKVPLPSTCGCLSTGWEFVFIFGPNNDRTFSYNNFPDNGYVPNIKRWVQKEFFDEHHATFPLELPEYFIQNLTKEGDIILDPFLGTGTTAIAAVRLNRRYIGIDISEKYCELARGRVDAVSNQKLSDWFDAKD